MFRECSIANFRGLRSLHVEGLRPVNLVVGRNNCGKTSLLEALFLMGGASTPAATLTLGHLRGQRAGPGSADALWRPLFHDLDPRRPIRIEARRDGEPGPRCLQIEALDARSFAQGTGNGEPGDGPGVASIPGDFVIGGLRLRYRAADGTQTETSAVYDPATGRIDAPGRDRDDFVRATYLSARGYPSPARDAQQFSALVRTKQEGDVLTAVRVLEPAVERIEVLSEAGGPSVYVDVGRESLVPLAVAGEGFVRVFSIAVELTASRRGLLLVDEIDSGLHYSVMRDLWALLRRFCAAHAVQVVATSHNDELLTSAMEVFAGDDDMLGVFRIDRRDGLHAATRYDAALQKAVLGEGFEVRG